MKGSEKLSKLKEVIQKKAYRENHENPFLLASGASSPYYLDLKEILFVPEYLDLACHIFLEKIKTVLDKPVIGVAGLTMGADPLLYGISLVGHRASIQIMPLVIRKEEKGHGSKKQIEGCLNQLDQNAPIALIDDVVTTGDSTIKAYKVLKKNSFSPKFAFSLVDREEGSYDNFKKNGIKLFSFFKLSDFKGK